MSYDVKCYDLAAAFLEDVKELVPAGQLPAVTDKLAQAIQDEIENFLAAEELT